MRNFTAALAPAATLVLLLVVVSPAAAATWTVSGREVWYRERSDEEARLVFGAWKAKLGKTYSSIAEEERRYAIFRDTLRQIDQHNAASEAGVDVYRMGLNEFTDLTSEEWNVMCCGSLPIEEPGLPPAGGRKERGGRSTRGIHYFMHLHRAYQAAAGSIWHWCVGVLGRGSHMGAQGAGDAAGWEGESPRGMAVSLGSTAAATEPK